MIHTLLLSTLYPNAAQPRHGLFVERRLLELLNSGEVQASVIAPVGRGRVRGAPRHETRHGVEVAHPRFVWVPKIGAAIHPRAIAAAVVRELRRNRRQVDLVDGHYLFPDGAAAALVARQLGVPLLLTARGSDVNVHAETRISRRWIRWALGQADAVITVSEALRQKLIAFGVDESRCVTLRNGVDLEAFQPVGRGRRERLMHDPSRHLVLMVGGLTGTKGFDLAIEALSQLPDCELAIAGEGPDRRELEALSRRLGAADRLHWLGPVQPADLPQLYSAADALCMASHREGMPNVVLESLACGTPIAGVAVGGVPEVVSDPVAGVLVDDNSPTSLALALRQLLASPPDRSAVRAFAERYSWQATTDGQLALMRQALSH